MDSFRRIARDMRIERQARSRSSSPAGCGFLFCEKHRLRYPISKGCTTCVPPRGKYRVR